MKWGHKILVLVIFKKIFCEFIIVEGGIFTEQSKEGEQTKSFTTKLTGNLSTNVKRFSR